jgi:tetratricopeptide (TPR) repeat protein
MNKGQMEAAIACYKRAIDLDPRLVGAHNNLGYALRAQGKVDAAIACFKRAIEIDPKYAKAHINLGAAFHSKRMFEEAIACGKKAIELDPMNPKTHNNLGTALHDTKNLAEAIMCYKKAIELDPNYSNAHCNLGNAYRDNDQLNEACIEYREVLHLNKDNAEVQCELGLILVRQGRFADALAELKRGHELGTKNRGWTRPSAQWVRTAEQLVQLDERLSALLAGKAQPKDTSERIAFAELCQKPYRQRYAVALRLYQEAFAADPKLTGEQPSVPRYNAACAAALAGCGQGKDADQTEGEERSRLRQLALKWLQADLAAYRRLLEQGQEKVRPVIAQQMQHWLKDTDFAGVRGPESLTKWPEPERQAWQHLWADVADTFDRAKSPTAPEKKPDVK